MSRDQIHLAATKMRQLSSSPIRATVSDTYHTKTVFKLYRGASHADRSHHSVLSHIISQLRPGADLSRVVLPTFILEPRSMLERITKCVSVPRKEGQIADMGIASWHIRRRYSLCLKSTIRWRGLCRW